MKITININKEIGEDFKRDKFYDFFERVIADIKYTLEYDEGNCSNYEKEIAEELERAFQEAEVE